MTIFIELINPDNSSSTYITLGLRQRRCYGLLLRTFKKLLNNMTKKQNKQQKKRSSLVIIFIDRYYHSRLIFFLLTLYYIHYTTITTAIATISRKEKKKKNSLSIVLSLAAAFLLPRSLSIGLKSFTYPPGLCAHGPFSRVLQVIGVC